MSCVRRIQHRKSTNQGGGEHASPLATLFDPFGIFLVAAMPQEVPLSMVINISLKELQGFPGELAGIERCPFRRR